VGVRINSNQGMIKMSVVRRPLSRKGKRCKAKGDRKRQESGDRNQVPGKRSKDEGRRFKEKRNWEFWNIGISPVEPACAGEG